MWTIFWIRGRIDICWPTPLRPKLGKIGKLQSKLNSAVQVRQGVDFVFPLSQEQEEEQEEQEQEEP